MSFPLKFLHILFVIREKKIVCVMIGLQYNLNNPVHMEACDIWRKGNE